MAYDQLRRRIATEAARLLYGRQETEFGRARRRAARRVSSTPIDRRRLPSNREIRSRLAAIERDFAPGGQPAALRDARLAALVLLHKLREFQPRVFGPALSGEWRAAARIRAQVFCDDTRRVAAVVQAGSCQMIAPREPDGASRRYPKILLCEPHAVEITVYPERLAAREFRHARSRVRVERATLDEFEQFLACEYPELPLDRNVLATATAGDRFVAYETLLAPLESLRQRGRQAHDHAIDLLHHSLQVFELARDATPYDEELLLAALLHDVGKGIDLDDPLAAALAALSGVVTERTLWFIEHLDQAHALREGSLGARSRRRLEESQDFDQLVSLARCDLEGRAAGVRTCDLRDALEYLRELAETCGE